MDVGGGTEVVANVVAAPLHLGRGPSLVGAAGDVDDAELVGDVVVVRNVDAEGLVQ